MTEGSGGMLREREREGEAHIWWLNSLALKGCGSCIPCAGSASFVRPPSTRAALQIVVRLRPAFLTLFLPG